MKLHLNISRISLIMFLVEIEKFEMNGSEDPIIQK